jgi:hypothetical protein
VAVGGEGNRGGGGEGNRGGGGSQRARDPRPLRESRREGGRYPRAGGDAAGAVYTVPLIVSRDSVLAARDVRE